MSPFFNRVEFTSDEKKRMEAEYWKGPIDHSKTLIKISDIRIKEWNVFFLENGLKNIGFNNKVILNIGGGSGKEAEYLLSNGAKSVVLIDIAPEQLSSARVRIEQHSIKNLELILCDSENLGIKNKSCDIGLIFMALHHFPNHTNAVSELCRTSKNVIIIDIMNCGLTRLLNVFGLFLKEGPLIINRVKEESIRELLQKNNFTHTIHYYFVPPYYGNTRFFITIIKYAEKTVNSLMSKSRIGERFFGNIAIIEGIQ